MAEKYCDRYNMNWNTSHMVNNDWSLVPNGRGGIVAPPYYAMPPANRCGTCP